MRRHRGGCLLFSTFSFPEEIVALLKIPGLAYQNQSFLLLLASTWLDQ